MKKIPKLLYIYTLFCSTSVFAQNIPNGQSLPPGTITYTRGAMLDYSSNSAPNQTPSVLNYSKTWVPKIAISDENSVRSANASWVKSSTQYFNGNGDLIEAVNRNFSNGKDLIVPFDTRRSNQKVTFLPYAASTNGKFQSQPFTDQANYYNVEYPNDNLGYSITDVGIIPNGNRQTVSYPPGKSFVGQKRGNTTNYYFNGTNEIRQWSVVNNLPITSGYYVPNQLVKTQTSDPEGNQLTTYVDNDGRTICKKVITGYGECVAGSNYCAQWLMTYYVYDDMGRLAFTLTPKAVANIETNNGVVSSDVLTELCFSYKYNSLGQTIEKTVPGQRGVQSFVYDRKGRQIFYQDARMKPQQKWSFTIYDAADRVMISGIYNRNISRSDLQNIVNNTYSGTVSDVFSYGVGGNLEGSYPTTLDNCDLMEFDYYDNYVNPVSAGRSFDGSYSSLFPTYTGTVLPTVSQATKGLLTARKTKVMKSSSYAYNDWVSSAVYYDDKGRVIQVQTNNPYQNVNNTWDVTTTQYNFSGQKVYEVTHHENPLCTTKSKTDLQKKYTYDGITGQLTGSYEKIDNGAWVTVSSYKYDDLGRVKTKGVGDIEMQDMSYNIRGQLDGINKDYVMTGANPNQNKTFGMQLSYDYGFSRSRYDGKIAGITWRGSGGNQNAYGFTYDNAGRLLTADYTYNMGSFIGYSNMQYDYSVSNLSYDANGNILTMKQRGMGILSGLNQKVDIDNLSYTYDKNGLSNRLMKVADQVTANYGLDDFHDGTNSGNDYTYDESGLLLTDLNKNISSSVYNVNGKLQDVTANGVSSQYSYVDNQLLQQITSGNKYDYWGSFVYYNGALQQIQLEEGRARYNGTTYDYDFFVRDNQGNVRNVLNAEVGITQQYCATHELSMANTERLVFDNEDNVLAEKPETLDPSDTKSAMLDGSDPKKQIGTSILLKVMAGDQFRISTDSYYNDNSGNDNVSADAGSMFQSLLGTLLGGQTRIPGKEGMSNQDLINKMINPDNYIHLYDALKEQQTNSSLPRAYLNYMVFDENMVLIPEQSGVVQVSNTANQWVKIEMPDQITFSKNGYLLAYISNEQYKPVYMDNLNISFSKGHLTEEKFYYPHGLPVNMGNSTTLVNKYLYSSNKWEKDNGLYRYDFHARSYDPQIGRFAAIDPLADFNQESHSPYSYCFNSPVEFTDRFGLTAAKQATVSDIINELLNNTPVNGIGYARNTGDGWVISYGDVMANIEVSQNYNPIAFVSWHGDANENGFFAGAFNIDIGRNDQWTATATKDDKKGTSKEEVSKKSWIDVAQPIMDAADLSVLTFTRIGLERANALSPSAGLMKGAKGIGNISKVLNILNISMSITNAQKNGWTTSAKIDVGARAAGFIPRYGTAFTIGWYATDLLSHGQQGMSLSEYLGEAWDQNRLQKEHDEFHKQMEAAFSEEYKKMN